MGIQQNSRVLNNLHPSFGLHSRLYENTQRIILMCLLLLGGVADETGGVKPVLVKEGESIILQNDATKLQKDDLIVWRFGEKGILLAKMDVETNNYLLNNADDRFRNRLQLDQTGSLNITNARTEHSGLYEVQIRGRESSQQFLVSVSDDGGLSSTVIAGIVVAVVLLAGLIAGIYFNRRISELQKQVVKEVKVKVGKSATLETDIEIKDGDVILWTFGVKNRLIFKAEPGPTSNCESVRGRLKLKNQNGSLTITNITNEDFGHYQLQVLSDERNRFRRFNVIEDSTVNKVKKLIEKDPLLLSVDEEDVQQETSSV